MKNNLNPRKRTNTGSGSKPMHGGARGHKFGFARMLRDKQTETEALLWEELRGKKLGGFKFRRQHPFARFVLDFYCHSVKLSVEVDGAYHNSHKQKEYDKMRTNFLKERGICELRFTNREVRENREKVLESILSKLQELKLIKGNQKPMTLTYNGTPQQLYWQGSPRDIVFDAVSIREKLERTDLPCYVMKDFNGRVGVSNTGALVAEGRGLQVLAIANPMTPGQLGDQSFKEDYQLKYAYKTGAMANGIASADLVIAMGKAGLLGSFGAAGLVPDRIRRELDTIQSNLIKETYAVNLIHSPVEAALESGAVELFLEKGVKVVEASAFLALTEHIVHYRVAGLSRNPDGSIHIGNKVIAKISRKEVAQPFMYAPPVEMLNSLLRQGKITADQAEMSKYVPMADDITVEADSGGHTDNRPLVVLLPIIIQLRNEIERETNYIQKIRVGAAGGISTPASALAAFMMGAAYVVTGSVNQACVEAGTSEHVRKLLQTVDSTDVMGAPASDMFEMGVELQVLKRGSMFGPRAKKLYEYYKTYKSIDEIPAVERTKLEKTVFRRPLEEIWQMCIDFFQQRDPEQIERAKGNPHRKMALIFRWYLGLSSNWANAGVPDRTLDYQIWCGPAMGSFNDWVRGTYLENYENRRAADVAERIMTGAAYLYRIQHLQMQGLNLPVELVKLPIEEKREPVPA